MRCDKCDVCVFNVLSVLAQCKVSVALRKPSKFCPESDYGLVGGVSHNARDPPIYV